MKYMYNVIPVMILTLLTSACASTKKVGVAEVKQSDINWRSAVYVASKRKILKGGEALFRGMGVTAGDNSSVVLLDGLRPERENKLFENQTGRYQ